LNRKLPAILGMFATAIWANQPAARAADTPTTDATLQPANSAGPAPTSQPPDKWQYTLVNPVPADEMRDMATDRPNITNSPQTIDAGHVQIETGIADYTYFQGSAMAATQWGGGDFNFRLGVLNNLEISADVVAFEEDIVRFHPADRTVRGESIGDTYLGGKLNLWGNDASDQVWGTALAIQPHFKIPTASTSVGNGDFEFDVLIPFSINLPDQFTLSIQPGFEYLRNADNTGYAPFYEQAFCIDRVFWNHLDLYVEYVFAVADGAHSGPTQLIDFGGIYQLRKNIALDTGIELGLNRASPTLAATVGVSVRF
jgi:hypothetical protein